MDITLTNIGKKFEHHWIFRNINFAFSSGNFYAITGPNGSGKSSLIKILAGYLTPSKGEIAFSINNQTIPVENIFQYCSVSAPFLQIPGEFSLWEIIRFHAAFKGFINDLTTENIIDLHGYQDYADAPLENFSSGMLQRVKLLLAICSDTPLLLLDEPSSYLDEQGNEWFKQLLNRFSKTDRLIIMSTNNPTEAALASEELYLQDFEVKKTNVSENPGNML